ncbi:MAG TPA: YncE family protein, partial [Blastocatellia bacterium]|nr:YncE family protein [Blastocatellia bacterium]
TVSVIDPLLGYGGSKLLTLVLLKSPGEDWILSRDGKRVFVTLPLINQVAVIDTATWKVVENIEVGMKPTRVALQGDGKYLWVGSNALDEAESGVSVVDTVSLKVAARIQTGAGHHEIAFAADDRVAFVTNRQQGTVSIIDTQRLAKIKDVKTGETPSSIAVSKLSKAVYVANEGDGTVFILDGDNHTEIGRIDGGRGVRVVRFSPDGRWGLAANAKENLVHIIDSSTNRIIETVPVGQSPDQITFTAGYGYIRSIGTEIVHSIALASIGKGASVQKFPGGQIPPMNAAGLNISDTIVAAPDQTSVLVANPADRVIYYYMEGMAAPMGNFQNYKREPRGVMVVDRSLRETSPGVYSTSVKFARGGNYDVAFLLGAPRIAHCFDLAVKPNPASEKWSRQTALRVEPLYTEKLIQVGQVTKLRFKLTDPATNLPKLGLKDVGVLTFLAPGLWNERQTARSTGEGIYEIEFVPPEAGPYYVFIESPSLKVKYRQLPYMILEATTRPVQSDERRLKR